MNKIHGFTLLEVLISMIVLSLGLLGVAGLQASGLKNNQSAYYRSQATQMIYDMADRMRSNTLGSSTYLSSAWTAGTPAAQAACTTVTTTCTPALMAQNDLFEWRAAIAAGLPKGVGTITLNGTVYTITINWDDNHDDAVNSSDPNFSIGFQL